MTRQTAKNVRPMTRWILAAAAGGIAARNFATHDAHAQYRVNNTNARDANNRLGSGGYNDPQMGAQGQYAGVSGNQIVTGNVTGGRGFRGNVPYTDPRAFRG